MADLRDLLAGDAVEVAPLLLGAVLRHDHPDGPVAVRLTEVEAYAGAADPGSHGFRGRTARNATMFGEAGHLYVYFVYGMHHCANVVTGDDGVGAAVLLRAVTPIDGIELMRERRNGRTDLADGPAKLCQAFGIGPTHNGADLCTATDIGLYDDGTPRTKHVTTNLVVDVDEAGDAATAGAYFTVLQATVELPLQIIVAGRYADRFARVGGKWRFSERLIHMDLQGDLSRHLRR